MTEGRQLPTEPDNGVGQREEKLTDGVLSIADSVKDGIQQMTEIHRTSSMGMRQMMNETESLKRATVEGAIIASGGETVESAPDSSAPSGTSGASITIKQPVAPSSVDAELDRNKAVSVQAVAGAAAILINSMFAAFYGSQLPTEVTAAIIILIQAVAQFGATLFNNYGKGKE